MRLNKKQEEVLECIRNEDPKFLLCCGAKRAGKTFILNLAMLGKIAEHEGENKVFILGGYSYSSIWRNVLNDWENILSIKIKITKDGHFNIFGNKVYIFNGSNVSSWKDVRGFTAQGAFLNEATALHESFVREVMSRCSESGSFVYMDTNPEGPQHYVYKEFYKKSGERLSSGKLNKQTFAFTLDDNDSLDLEYIESIKLSTPPGMYYDRDILGKWVNPKGVIFDMFNPETMIKELDIDTKLVTVFAGIDWGFNHKGVISIVGIDSNDNLWVIDEVCERARHIDWWIEKAKWINKSYGNIPYYADTEDAHHRAAFSNKGLKIFSANKRVLAGIELLSLLFHNHKLFISPKCKNLIKELGLYSWNEKDDKPLKENDDSIDALRYAIYSFYSQYKSSFNWIHNLEVK